MRGDDGVYTVQKFFADFLLTFREQYDRIVVFGLVRPGAKSFSGRLDAPELEVVPLPSGLRNRLAAWKSLWQALPVDVFWGHMPNMLVLYPLVPLVRRRVGKFIVYNGSDFERFVFESNYGSNPLFRRYVRWAYRDSLRHSDVVIARGKRLCRQAEALNPRVEETIPMANLEFWAQGALDRKPEGAIEIIFAGQMLWSKGLRELLKAFEGLTTTFREATFRLNLLGEGEDLEDIRSFAQSLSCAEQTVFYGWVDNPEVLNGVWSRATLVVMPTTTYPEGVPRVIEEGVCRRLPVVATKVSGVPEEFSTGEVLLVEPGSVKALQTGMEQALFDGDVRRSLRMALEGRLAHLRRHRSAAHQHLAIIRELYTGNA